MNPINQTFDLAAYTGKIVTLKKAGNYWIGPCPFCGGRDRFNVKGPLWICRQCGDGKYHDAIDFIERYHRVGYKEAVQIMGGNIDPLPARTQPQRAQIEIPSQEWQGEAWREIEAANDCLLGIPSRFDALQVASALSKDADAEEGRVGKEYLKERGIHRGMWTMFNLGYGIAYGRSAIFIPFTDGSQVTAIKYRYLTDKGGRYGMKTGSKPLLFGLQNVLESDRTLLLLEGELNAISVFQIMPKGVSVISFGSETGSNISILKALAQRYDRVIIWTDDPAKGRAVRERMNRPEARLLKSPVIENVKYDANQMLQAGLLLDFVSGELATVCNGIPHVPAELANVDAIR